MAVVVDGGRGGRGAETCGRRWRSGNTEGACRRVSRLERGEGNRGNYGRLWDVVKELSASRVGRENIGRKQDADEPALAIPRGDGTLRPPLLLLPPSSHPPPARPASSHAHTADALCAALEATTNLTPIQISEIPRSR